LLLDTQIYAAKLGNIAATTQNAFPCSCSNVYINYVALSSILERKGTVRFQRAVVLTLPHIQFCIPA